MSNQVQVALQGLVSAWLELLVEVVHWCSSAAWQSAQALSSALVPDTMDAIYVSTALVIVVVITLIYFPVKDYLRIPANMRRLATFEQTRLRMGRTIVHKAQVVQIWRNWAMRLWHRRRWHLMGKHLQWLKARAAAEREPQWAEKTSRSLISMCS